MALPAAEAQALPLGAAALLVGRPLAPALLLATATVALLAALCVALPLLAALLTALPLSPSEKVLRAEVLALPVAAAERLPSEEEALALLTEDKEMVELALLQALTGADV